MKKLQLLRIMTGALNRNCCLSRIQQTISTVTTKSNTTTVIVPFVVSQQPWKQGLLWHSPDACFSRRWKGSVSDKGNMDVANENHGSAIIYLHVGPSGDCWTGDSIFAAKHLQPDYVKSIPLPFSKDDIQQQQIDNLLEFLEGKLGVSQQIYDTETISSDLLERFF